MSRILMISSNIHKELSARQLLHCERLVKNSVHEYQIEVTPVGTYEIPFIINTYHQKNSFDGYIALGLVLKTNLDHYNYIMSHIENCFTTFALNSIVVGNGIVCGENLEDIGTKIDSQDPCQSAYASAFNAVDYLIKLKKDLS
ncbi:MAG: 6,7-dimethyl-8-ribityllumazine synthase [Tatlockia sp.]|nr:6,7-dimethyl-8-ribityllumazine synthase [Tatlockia sp.]